MQMFGLRVLVAAPLAATVAVLLIVGWRAQHQEQRLPSPLLDSVYNCSGRGRHWPC